MFFEATEHRVCCSHCAPQPAADLRPLFRERSWHWRSPILLLVSQFFLSSRSHEEVCFFSTRENMCNVNWSDIIDDGQCNM